MRRSLWRWQQDFQIKRLNIEYTVVVLIVYDRIEPFVTERSTLEELKRMIKVDLVDT